MRTVLSALLVIISLATFAQNDQPQLSNKYSFSLDLNKTNDDLLQITLETPKITTDKTIYIIPKIVPGTYSIYDFGQYVLDLEAFDKDGRALSVTTLDKNRWEIDDAKKLAKISYWVEDTWDAEVEELVFEPGGTNIETGENIVLNNHGFFGYFDGMKNLEYELNITRPADFYGSTGLLTGTTDGNVDKFTTLNYMDLVDAPIMYNVPDTTVFKVGNTDILISVYSKNKVATAKELAVDIKKILEAQSAYLGGLPVEKYAFIIYLYSGQSGSGGSGALEHSYSSFYYLPEMSADKLSGFVVDVAAHEFFHIVTPLNIHSVEIGDFDFITPKMSKHLWMYEGVTEYFAGHVQVYEDLITTDDYIKVIEEKLNGANRYKDDLPFTEMSLGCLDKHKDQYGNVYQKGALIGMCLDVLLREQSAGKNGMKDMMKRLSTEYGKYKSFNDEELFDKITEFSSPVIGTFFKEYVEGSKALPLEDVLNKVGITFKQDVTVQEITLGEMALSFNPETSRLFIIDTGSMNEFGKKMGYQNNDEIVSLNGTEISMTNAKEEITKFKKETKAGDKVEIVVARKAKGAYKNKKLKGKAVSISKTKKYIIELNKDATEKQLALRKAWLGQK
jgi:predicted metalloprotease with PDZ domain